MKAAVPQCVREARASAFLLLPGDSAVEFYVREDDFTLGSYPASCPVEFCLAAWDDTVVMCIACLVQVAGRYSRTFQRWLNASHPNELRILQLLATQKMLNLHLVANRQTRSLRRRNYLAGKAAGLVATLRVRRTWEDEQFEEQRKRYDTLYPTPDALWRGARELRK